jgi:hypothetical protein
MKNILNHISLLQIAAIFTLSAFRHHTQPDIPPNILCEAKNLFNPEKASFFNQFGKPSVLDYFGMNNTCNISRILKIESAIGSPVFSETQMKQLFDAKRRLIAISSGSDSSIYSTNFAYNAAGLLIKKTEDGLATRYFYRGNEFVQSVTDKGVIISFEKKGLVTTETMKDASGNILLLHIKKYDAKKRVIEEAYDWVKEKKSNAIYYYEYNDSGWVKSNKAVYSNSVINSVRGYDTKGLLISDSVFSGNKLQVVYTCSYFTEQSSQGFHLWQNKLYTDGSVERTDYFFDNQGNWIEKQEKSSYGLDKKEKRKIFYR